MHSYKDLDLSEERDASVGSSGDAFFMHVQIFKVYFESVVCSVEEGF